MEKFHIDLNPSGVKTEHGFEENKVVIRQEMDLEPLIEYTTALRNADDYSKEGIKKGFFHVASIDAITQVELLKLGIDIYRASAREIVGGIKRLHREHLLTTRKNI